MSERVVPQHLVDQIRLEYKAGGISQMQLASKYDLSETTIFRILHHSGAYKMITIERPKVSDEQLAAEAKASADRLMRMLNGEELVANADKPVESFGVEPKKYY